MLSDERAVPAPKTGQLPLRSPRSGRHHRCRHFQPPEIPAADAGNAIEIRRDEFQSLWPSPVGLPCRAFRGGPDTTEHTELEAACPVENAAKSPNHPETLPMSGSRTEDEWSTEILSAVIPNSHRASMISNALFIIVAESTEILGPIFQVGCFKAISGVTVLSCSLRVVSEWTTTRREHDALAGHDALPVCRHWNMALCSLSTGIIDRARLARHVP
jgi:hypothetical protein